MKILFAASEASPFAKAGGLADVMGALPKEISKHCDVALIIPRHRCTLKYPTEKICSVKIKLGWREQYAELSFTEYNGLKVFFIGNEYYFGGDKIYGYDEGEAEKYAFFSKAVLELLPYMGDIPDIIHCNDWQTGLIPCLIKNFYTQYSIKTVFTIHNLKYRGLFGFGLLRDLLNFPDSLFTSETLEFYGSCSYLKAGLLYGDKITCVSPTYRNETLSYEYGEGMEGVLKMRQNDYVGILNGLGEEFNPEFDSALAENYTAENLCGKESCKKSLQREAGLNCDGSVPVFAIVARLYDQKGIDLIKSVIHEIMFLRPIQLVVLGSGDKNYEDFFLSLNEIYHGRVKTYIGYDEELARRIYAGSDFFLMPSLFEPCGLSQLIAMKYASLPIVRSCGGLKDTVTDVSQNGWGFVFNDYSADALKNAIFRACDFYKDADTFNTARKRAALRDTSWQNGAKAYLDLYTDILGGKK